ncbi:uncharacterized protein LOC127132020 [Lathyrus oleraceus]|uniref:uncharacterized protein LOC127132020 n=1 Tax=Pisum sativum TaxID=3888 RepID=UPI0021CFB3DA|nr:uncharacterized protein LOC127132020 [Pisum sativum]
MGNFLVLKYAVQNMLDSKAIQFTLDNGPNVIQNPMPTYNGLVINAIEDGEKYLIKNDVYPDCVPECCKCKSQPEGCDDLKAGIQSLINEKGLYSLIELRRIRSEKVVSWYYGSDVYYHGVKQEEKSSKEKLCMDGNLSVDHLADSVDALEKAKGKQVMADNQELVQINVPQQSAIPSASSSQEVEELLRIIKKSDYKVVDQLSKTSSKISILSLPLCSKTHRNALVKLLSFDFVPQEITVNQLEGVVASISADNGLGFTDFDLLHEGRNHNKYLHISMEYKCTTLSRVLVDIGSSLNVLPKLALMKIDYVGVELCLSDLIVRAFGGSQRAVFGKMDIPVKIRPQLFDTTFFVIDIQPAYCCLLGRPWIHGAWSITSTLR